MKRLARVSIWLAIPALAPWGCGDEPVPEAAKAKPEKKVPAAVRAKPVPGKAKARPEKQTSAWGRQGRGLQIRVTAPKEIEQGERLFVSIALRGVPGKLPEGVRKLNTFLPDNYLKLHLFNVATRKKFLSAPYDPTGGMPCFDEGKAVAALDGGAIGPWRTFFPLVGLKLPPGKYECRVKFAYPEETDIWKKNKRVKARDAGLWSGKAVSGAFELLVLKETPKFETYRVPTRLRLEKPEGKGLNVNYGPKDTEAVKLPVRNGFYVAAKLYLGKSDRYTALGGVRPVSPPDDPNPVYWVYDYKGGDFDQTYTLEIFETSAAPCHGWHPRNGTYKTLWKKTFRVRSSAAEIRKLTRPEAKTPKD